MAMAIPSNYHCLTQRIFPQLILQYNYVKWTEQGNEPPGWYRACVSEYFQDGFCRKVYEDTSTSSVSEILHLRSVNWLPCSKRAKRYVSLNCFPKSLKSKQKPSPKYYSSMERSVKAYADDVTLISDSLKVHASVLQQIDRKAADLYLSFKPSKCVLFV